MRILYHHRTLGDCAEGIHIESMIRAFRRLGHDVLVKSLMPTGEGEVQEETRRMGRLIKRLPRAVYELAEMAYNIRAYPALLEAIRRFRPDLVYDRYNLYNDCAIGAARAASVPSFLEVNSPYAYQRRTYERLHYARYAAWSEARTWRRADRVIVVSSPLKRFVVQTGVPEERIDVIPNGVDLELFSPRSHERSARLDSEVVIGFVGSLRRWHGVDLLIDASAPLLQDGLARLVIVGDGPDRGALQERVRSRNVEARVQFRGSVLHDAIPAEVGRFDVAVSPRCVFYQSPMKVLEYMAMKCAVIAPDSENVRDLVEPEREALLFPPDDVAALGQALRRAVGDPGLRGRLGENARVAVERRHTWIGNARRVIARWEEIRSGSPAPTS